MIPPKPPAPMNPRREVPNDWPASGGLRPRPEPVLPRWPIWLICMGWWAILLFLGLHLGGVL